MYIYTHTHHSKEGRNLTLGPLEVKQYCYAVYNLKSSTQWHNTQRVRDSNKAKHKFRFLNIF